MWPGREVSPAEPGAELVHVATVLHLRRWRYLFPFMRMNSRVFKQLNQTPGLVRWRVNAEFRANMWYTYTVWKDRSSKDTFMVTEPHATAMKRANVWSGPRTAFVQWVSPDGAIDWNEAKRRLRSMGRTLKPLDT